MTAESSKHSLELLGSGPLRAFLSLVMVLELRLLCSPGITRLGRSYEPLRHPARPSLSLAGCRLGWWSPAVMGFPCYRRTPLPPCRRHYPGERTRCWLRSLGAPCQPSPNLNRVGVRITFFEACSAFTHVTACVLADSLDEPLTSGASTAAVASDVRPNCFRRSENCRVGGSLPHGSSALPRRTENCRLALMPFGNSALPPYLSDPV
jgi:hypothetical protein